MAEDVVRQERRDRPVVTAAEALEEGLQTGEGNRRRHERHRHQVVVLDQALREGKERDEEHAERDRRDKHDERREADEAAQIVVLATRTKLRHVAHGRIAEAERGDGGEDQEPDPGIGEDAVFVLAHQAGEHDLREIGERGARKPDRKRDRSRAPRHASLVLAAGEIAGAREELAQCARRKILL